MAKAEAEKEKNLDDEPLDGFEDDSEGIFWYVNLNLFKIRFLV